MAKHITHWQLIFLAWSGLSVMRTSSQLLTVTENESDVFLFTEKFSLPSPSCNVTKMRNTLNEGAAISWTEPVRVENGLYSVNVTLTEALDFEYIMEKNNKNTLDIQLTATFVCVDEEEQKLLPKRTIFVTDVKDSIPEFQLSRYEVTVPENEATDTIIVYNVTAIDRDSDDQVDYVIETSAESDRDVFKGIVTVKNIEGKGRYVLDIYLAQPIDYESATRHSFTVTAKDTVNSSSSCEVVIQVKDVQDTPPSFSLPIYSGRVDEMAPKGTSVAKVSAMDGDGPSVRNRIVYSIVEGLTNDFMVDSNTGVISTKGLLDIDGNNSIGTNGLVILTLQAEELNSSGEIQYGNTTARTAVQIQIDDANDHPPLFGSPTYSGSIRGGAVAGEIVSIDGGGYISVTDQDLAPTNNHFRLHIEQDGKPWSVFDTNIQSQFVQASVLIVLKEPVALENLQNTHIKFQVVATDFSRTSKSNMTSSIAEVIVFVLPRVTSAPPPEPIVDLPISESDVIVFIMGFLLLLNIVLTLIICRLMCRNNDSGGGFSLFRRNSKYYVSKKGRLDSGGVERVISHDDENKTVSNGNGNHSDGGQNRATTMVPPLTTAKERKGLGLTDAAINRNTQVRNTIFSTANRNRCDVTYLNDVETGMANGVSPGKDANVTEGEKESGLSNNRVQSDRCDVTPMNRETLETNSNGSKTDASNNKCDVVPLESSISSKSNALSSLLDRVHQKLALGNKNNKSDTCDLRPLKDDDSSLNTSTNSSFSDKTKYGVTPFTDDKSSQSATDTSTSASPSHVNLAYVQNETEADALKVSKRGQITNSPNADIDPANEGVAKQPQQIQQQQHQKQKPAITFVPTLSPSQTQLTQTGVPPVALALPLGTSTSHKTNENTRTNAVTVSNPVYNEDGKGGRITTLRDFSVPKPPELFNKKVKTTDMNQVVSSNSRQEKDEATRGKGILRQSSSLSTDSNSNPQPSGPKQTGVDYVAAAKLLLNSSVERVDSMSRDGKDKE